MKQITCYQCKQIISLHHLPRTRSSTFESAGHHVIRNGREPTVLAMPSHKVVDYSKWELVADDDDKKERQYREVREHHQESMTVIASFLRETSPGIKSSELRRHLDFISVQHRGIYETNLKRAAEICAFLERLGPDEQLDTHKLAELVRAARKQSEEGEEKEKTRGLLVLNVAMGALNTLAAVNDIGKPRWLFDMLHTEPEGPVMKKYKEFGYALDELRKPPVDPYARELPVDMKSWCSKLWKAVALQMAISLVLMSVALSAVHYFGPDWESMGFNADSNDAGRLHEPKPITLLQDDDWETAQQEL